jgi:hypothetical protein
MLPVRPQCTTLCAVLLYENTGEGDVQPDELVGENCQFLVMLVFLKDLGERVQDEGKKWRVG